MSKTKTRVQPIAGPEYDKERPETRGPWLAQRRGGITATEVAKAAAGRASDIAKIVAEKVSGEDTLDLTGNKFIDYGNAREPIIADYVQRRFGVEPNQVLFARGDNPRHLATPDGYIDDAFTGDVFVGEIKTSRHDLWPFPFARDYAEHGIPWLTPSIAENALRALDRGDRSAKFWDTGYYDQIQWQMYVMDASRAIFAFEQHDDNWPNPKPKREADTIWVERDDARIAYLIDVAERLLAKIDASTPDSIAPASDVDPDVADHVHKYLHALADEKVAGEVKSTNWKWLQEHFKNVDEYRNENDEAKITWARSEKSVTTISDELLEHASAAQAARIEKGEQGVARALARIENAEAALVKARDALDVARARLDGARKPFSVTAVEYGTPRLTITAKQTKSAD
jgi:hypothetical protein